MKIPNRFFSVIFWAAGVVLLLAAVGSLYIRFITIKYDLRQTGYETESLGGE
jgi:hypothetical protein